MKRLRTKKADDRRGAVAVEFAAIAPLLLTIVLGLVEVNRVYDTQHLLESAAREGARFAAMDRDAIDTNGQSTNQKLVNDVLTFLEANGLPRDEIEVSVLDYQNPEQEFDLDDPDNELLLFTVEVSIDYSEVSFTPVESGDDYPLTATVTFRNGVASISE